MSRFPDIHPSEWAEFFNVGWAGKSPEFCPPERSETGTVVKRRTDAISPRRKQHNSAYIEKFIPPRFWFVNSIATKTQTETQQFSISLAPRINEKSEPVKIRYFESDARWRARLDQRLAIEETLDVPDIEQCISRVVRCMPLKPLPLQKERFHNISTTILVDHNPPLEPIHGWRRQQVSLVRAMVGEQMTTIEPVECAPLHREHRQQLIDASMVTTRVVILTSLDTRWIDPTEITAWQALVNQLQVLGREVLVLQPETNSINKAIVHQILGCAAGLVYPECHTLVALAKLLGGGLQDALAAWNHPDLTCPSQIFHISDVARKKDLLAYYEQMPGHVLQAVNALIASHRALKPDCQIAMESLSRAAQQFEPLPAREWIERLINSTAAMSIEARAAYFRGLASEYENIRRHFEQHPDLQPLFELVDVVIPKKAVQSAPDNTINIVPAQNGFKLNRQHHPHSIYSASGPFFNHDGLLLKTGLQSSESDFQVNAKDHTFTLTPLTLPTWADRIYRDPEGRLIAAHQSGTRFERVPASATNATSYWRNYHKALKWASDTGIDDNGLWADLSIEDANYRLRWIPAGEFDMGSPETEDGRYEDETLHTVKLSNGFWLGEITVTNEFWQTVMNNQVKDRSGTQPATDISWDDCSTFIKTLTELQPTLTPRFPTEAEWEYACRAGTQTAYWWGDHWSGENGNNGSGVNEENQYPPNTYGLKSMHGSVLEWCNDWYGDYPEGTATDPPGPASGQRRVLRGGSWIGVPRNLRAARRFHFSPGHRFYGFRLAGGDAQAGRQQGASATADRGEGTESQRGGQVRRAGQ